MRTNCNLDLRLMPPSSISTFSPKNCNNTSYLSMEDKENTELKKQSQQLTIFYNGKLAVFDVTELQAKTIIYLASREMKEKTNKTPSPMSEPSSPLLQPQTGLFMKKSLQRFLQKRKNRIQTTKPYHH